MCRAQRTLAEEISFEGVGIHTGKPGHLTIKPASVDHGIVFLVAGNIFQLLMSMLSLLSVLLL